MVGDALLLALLLLAPVRDSACLRMTKVKIPSPVQAGTRVMLSCFFDLAWGERVYIVNWYRNGKEFYRFSPSESPSIQTFSRPGIFVDTFASNMTTVVLRSVPLNSAGRYRCEIATEAPSYVTVHGQRYMSVVDLPSEGPKIAGARDLYRIGEPVSINCTSARSRPAASLTWYINGEQADPSLVEDYPIHRHMDGLETSKISLKFGCGTATSDTAVVSRSRVLQTCVFPVFYTVAVEDWT
ncbi:cell adhesion molecule 1-like [Pollicipes pollicipes]|uniref:cell adhesion molecule 1-like n=1 Tax=Pollicipes pollicipes TaxID=41117 RepID=UPI0018852597|nr:cell adhesion molecule 1-like [Pollicipes pollicipes]